MHQNCLLSHKWRCNHDVSESLLISKSSPLPLTRRDGRVGEVAQGGGGHSRGGRGGRDKEDPLLTFASKMMDFISQTWFNIAFHPLGSSISESWAAMFAKNNRTMNILTPDPILDHRVSPVLSNVSDVNECHTPGDTHQVLGRMTWICELQFRLLCLIAQNKPKN